MKQTRLYIVFGLFVGVLRMVVTAAEGRQPSIVMPKLYVAEDYRGATDNVKPLASWNDVTEKLTQGRADAESSQRLLEFSQRLQDIFQGDPNLQFLMQKIKDFTRQSPQLVILRNPDKNDPDAFFSLYKGRIRGVYVSQEPQYYSGLKASLKKLLYHEYAHNLLTSANPDVLSKVPKDTKWHQQLICNEVIPYTACATFGVTTPYAAWQEGAAETIADILFLEEIEARSRGQGEPLPNITTKALRYIATHNSLVLNSIRQENFATQDPSKDETLTHDEISKAFGTLRSEMSGMWVDNWGQRFGGELIRWEFPFPKSVYTRLTPNELISSEDVVRSAMLRILGFDRSRLNRLVELVYKSKPTHFADFLYFWMKPTAYTSKQAWSKEKARVEKILDRFGLTLSDVLSMREKLNPHATVGDSQRITLSVQNALGSKCEWADRGVADFESVVSTLLALPEISDFLPYQRVFDDSSNDLNEDSSRSCPVTDSP